ncbi:MAG: penicillin-binding protein 2 [Desulfobulbaceae bacterium]|nr:penicillin-binding protein 2 [Desulfobulbaceae bacterium]
MAPHPLTKINKIDPAELKMLKKRIDIAMVIIIFCAALLLTRLWYLQIYRGDEYAKLSEINRIRIQEIAAPRGNILDRTGRPIITNRPRFNVVWSREDAPNPDVVIKDLARILNEDISVLLDRIRAATENPRYMPTRLKEDIDWETLVTIENKHLSLPGVRIEVVPSRDYLYGDFASHLVGYLAEISPAELTEKRYAKYQSGDQVGKQGVEKIFEEYLKGEKGRNYLEVDVHGFEQRQMQLQEPYPGNDLHLTLDIDLQRAAEEAMDGRAGAVVVMEVNTGNLLAMCSSPSLHLQEFVGGISTTAWNKLLNDPLNPLLDKTIQGQYPPGSTFKIVTALAAISEGIITPDATYFCGGSLNFGNRRYGCWKKGGHGTVDFQRALIESCDVYFYSVGMRLGVDKIAKYANSLGLGKKTGIELEHEKSGNIPSMAWKQQRYKEKWQDGETLSVAIGQGYVLTTPLQLCRMTAAVVNGGTLYRPQMVQSITAPDGRTLKTFAPINEGKILGSAHSLALIKEALVGVVNSPGGTAKVVKLPDVLIGGKTGTAQVVRLAHVEGMSEKSIPYKYRDHAWFTSYAPAEKPEIAITVLVEHGQHGGSAAGPVARAVYKRYFELKNGKDGEAAEPAPPLAKDEKEE